MATNPRYEEGTNMDVDTTTEGVRDDEGAESSYGITFTAEDAVVRGDRGVVVPSNIVSVVAGAAPTASTAYGLFSSANPSLEADHARDAVIPGANSVDTTRGSLVLEHSLDQTPADETKDEDDTILCLQMVGVIPFILDVFKPRCSLHIKYSEGDELRNGDVLYLSDERPSVVVQQREADTLLPGSLFTVLVVEVDGGQRLGWGLVNFSGGRKGLELVSYEAPRLTHGRRPCLFVCYSQSQPFHLVPVVGRDGFDLRRFAAAHALDDPVAAVYVTVAAERS